MSEQAHRVPDEFLNPDSFIEGPYSNAFRRDRAVDENGKVKKGSLPVMAIDEDGHLKKSNHHIIIPEFAFDTEGNRYLKRKRRTSKADWAAQQEVLSDPAESTDAAGPTSDVHEETSHMDIAADTGTSLQGPIPIEFASSDKDLDIERLEDEVDKALLSNNTSSMRELMGEINSLVSRPYDPVRYPDQNSALLRQSRRLFQAIHFGAAHLSVVSGSENMHATADRREESRLGRFARVAKNVGAVALGRRSILRSAKGVVDSGNEADDEGVVLAEEPDNFAEYSKTWPEDYNSHADDFGDPSKYLSKWLVSEPEFHNDITSPAPTFKPLQLDDPKEGSSGRRFGVHGYGRRKWVEAGANLLSGREKIRAKVATNIAAAALVLFMSGDQSLDRGTYNGDTGDTGSIPGYDIGEGTQTVLTPETTLQPTFEPGITATSTEPTQSAIEPTSPVTHEPSVEPPINPVGTEATSPPIEPIEPTPSATVEPTSPPIEPREPTVVPIESVDEADDAGSIEEAHDPAYDEPQSIEETIESPMIEPSGNTVAEHEEPKGEIEQAVPELTIHKEDGFTHLLRQYRPDLDGPESYALFKYLEKQFGAENIFEGITIEELPNGDPGIKYTGTTRFAPGVQEVVDAWPAGQ